MSATWNVEVGEKGRLVIPSDIRSRRNWQPGTSLVALESDIGVTLLSREVLHDLVVQQLSGAPLVIELLSERRAEAAREDSA